MSDLFQKLISGNVLESFAKKLNQKIQDDIGAVDTKLDEHNHDGVYYTEAEVDNIVGLLQEAINEINDIPYEENLAFDTEEIIFDGLINSVMGQVGEDNKIVLNGVLQKGIYIIQYELEDGSLVDIGTLNVDGNSDTNNPTVTNYFDIKTALLNHRLGSGGNTSAFNGMLVTDYIPVNSTMYGQRFWINGVTLINSSSYNYIVRIVYYDTSKNMVNQNNYINSVEDLCYYVRPVPSESFTEGYIRISLVLKDGEALSESDVANLTITLVQE